MIILIIYAFLAGIVTILSPCILPLLPIILSSSLHPKSKKPLGIILGFVSSFTFFTLFLSGIVQTIGVSADLLRNLSIFILISFGLTMLFDKFNEKIEFLTSKLIGRLPRAKSEETFVSGIVIGLSLGLLWTPCVGPILASVITLSFSGAVNLNTALITLAYSLGTAIPMFVIMKTGGAIFQKIPTLRSNLPKIQKGFAVLMILTAIALYFGLDRNFQTYVLDKFPSYGANLTKFEDNVAVKQALESLQKVDPATSNSDNNDSKSSKTTYPLAPDLISGGEWINSTPLALSNLKGKVVLIDFWTYTCINCIRTLPYLKTWYEKYEKDDLVIIGVHAPEFEFEKNLSNVQKAVSDFGIKYPIMQDNDFATWKAYRNRYWPAKYLIDKEGYIRYSHFGEGEYDTTEAKIQELLREAGKEIDKSIANPEYEITSGTPEIYLGSQRATHFSGFLRLQKGIQNFPTDKSPSQDEFLYTGTWEVGDESAKSKTNDAGLLLHFQASQLHLVMSANQYPKTIKVFLDDKLVANEIAGSDVKDGELIIDSARKYDLIKLSSPEKHLLRLVFPADVEVFAFTFG